MPNFQPDPQVELWNDDPEWKALPLGTKQTALSNYFDKEYADREFWQLDRGEQARIKNNFITAHFGHGEGVEAESQAEVKTRKDFAATLPPAYPQEEAPKTPQDMVRHYVQQSLDTDPFLADVNREIDGELQILEPQPAPEPKPEEKVTAIGLMAPPGTREGMTGQPTEPTEDYGFNWEKGGFTQQVGRQALGAAAETVLSAADLIDRTLSLIPGMKQDEAAQIRDQWKKQIEDFKGQPEGMGGYMGATTGRLMEFVAEMAAGGEIFKGLGAANQVMKFVSKIPGDSKFAGAVRYIAQKVATDTPIFAGIEALRTQGDAGIRADAALQGARMGLTFALLEAIPGKTLSLGTLARVPLGNFLLDTNPVETAKIISDPNVSSEDKMTRLFDTAVNTYFSAKGFTKESVAELHENIKNDYEINDKPVPQYITDALDKLERKAESASATADDIKRAGFTDVPTQPFTAERPEAEGKPTAEPITKELTPEVEKELQAEEAAKEGQPAPTEHDEVIEDILSNAKADEEVPATETEKAPAPTGENTSLASTEAPGTTISEKAGEGTPQPEIVNEAPLPETAEAKKVVSSRAAGMESHEAYPRFRILENKYKNGTPEEQAALDIISDDEFGTNHFDPQSVTRGAVDNEELQDAVERLSKEGGLEWYPDWGIKKGTFRDFAKTEQGEAPVQTPVIEGENKPAEPILARSGNPYKTAVAAQRRANELGPDYEVRKLEEGHGIFKKPVEAPEIKPAITAEPVSNPYKSQAAEEKPPVAESATTEPIPASLEPKMGTGEIILASSGVPFANKKAAQTYAKRKGEGYEPVPYGDKWAVRKTPPVSTPAREATEEDRRRADYELDQMKKESGFYDVKPPVENPGMEIEGPEGVEPIQFSARPQEEVPRTSEMQNLTLVPTRDGFAWTADSEKGKHLSQAFSSRMEAKDARLANKLNWSPARRAGAASIRPAIGQPGMGVIRTERAMKDIRLKMKSPFDVIGGVEDIPDPDVRRTVESKIKEGNIISAFIDPKTNHIVVLADNVRDENELLTAILPHEITHYGTKGVLGERAYNGLLKDLAADQHIGPQVKELMDKNGWKADHAASEWWADNAEGKDLEKLPKNILQRVIFLFKRWLRKNFGWGHFDFTDGQITEMLRQSYEYARTQPVRDAISGDSPQARAEKAHQEWYSQMQNVIEQKLPNVGTVPGFKNVVQALAMKGDFKTEELYRSGLLTDSDSPLAKDVGKVTRQEVIDWLRENNVQVETIEKKDIPESEITTWVNRRVDEIHQERNDMDWGSAQAQARGEWITQHPDIGTKFASYQTPGGENYREVLLILPTVPRGEAAKLLEQAKAAEAEVDKITSLPASQSMYNGKDRTVAFDEAMRHSGELRTKLQELTGSPRGERESFRGPHYNEPGVIAHLRVNDRTDADGKKSLFIEEVQSDREIAIRRGTYSGKSWKNWQLLAMKKALRMAVEDGYDRLSWITGEETAKRYDLSKQIDSLQWARDKEHNTYEIVAYHGTTYTTIGNIIDPDKLSQYIGKDAADKIINNKENDGELSGLDLKVGGEWAVNLYDKQLVNEMNKYVKKWGGKVGEANIITAEGSNSHFFYNGMEYWKNDEGDYVKIAEDLPEDSEPTIISLNEFKEKQKERFGKTAHSLDINPSMRESVLMGQPQFRMTNVRDIQAQLKEIYKAIDALPPMRNNQPTSAIRQRLEMKAQELERMVAEKGGDINFRARQPEGTRVQKRISALEANIPEKEKDEFVRRYLSTDIRQKIKAIKEGRRLGDLDLKESMKEVKDFVLEYARRYLPVKDMTRGQVKPLLTAVARAENADDMIAAYDRIDKITRTVTEKQLLGDIHKMLKQYRPKVKEGKISEKRITAEESSRLAEIRGIEKQTPEALEEMKKNLLATIQDITDKSPEELIQMKDDLLKSIGKEAPEGQLGADLQDRQETLELLRRLDLFGDLKDKTVSQLREAHDEIKSIIESGRVKRKAADEERNTKMKETRTQFVDIISNKRGVLSEAQQIAAKPEEKQPGFFKRWHLKSLSLKSYLDIISGHAKKERIFHGAIIDQIMPLVHESQRVEKNGKEDTYTTIQNKFAEIYGTRDSKKQAKISYENSKRVDTGVKIKIGDQEVPLIMSQNEAYHRWQEWQRSNTAAGFEKMGYTQETIDGLWKFLKPEVQAWAKWQMEEFNPVYHNRINEIFRQIAGVDLPFDPNYTEVIRDHDPDIKEDYLMSTGSNFVASVYSDRLKATVPNALPIRLVDGDRMLIKRISELEHFRAWALNVRDIRSLLGHPDVQRAIAQNYGRDLLASMNDHINDIARGAINPLLLDRGLNRIRGRLNGALLGCSISMTPKQASSVLAYGMTIPLNDFTNNLAEFWKDARKNADLIMGTDYYKHRYGTGYNRDMIANLNRAAREKAFGMKSKFKNAQYFFMTAGDKLSVIYGGWTVYKYYYDKEISAGKSHAEAHKKALEEFESASNETQQSGEISDLPAMMRQGGWSSMLTMFMTQKNIYYQKEAGALRNLFAGRGSKSENMKIFAMSHILMPMLWQFVGNGFRWDKWDELRAAILGSINGYLVWGSIAEATLDKTFGSPFKIFSNPLFDNAETAGRTFADIVKYAASGEYNAKDTMKLINATLESGSTILGVPYKTVENEAKNIYRFVKHPTHGTSMVLLGYSPSALGLKDQKKKLLDEYESYSERPKSEQNQRELDQLKAEVDEYNKGASTFQLPLVKEEETRAASRAPKQEAARLLNLSGTRALSDQSVKRFKHKLAVALENREISQAIYDTWMKSFKRNQDAMNKIKQDYYEQGREVPRGSSANPRRGPAPMPRRSPVSF